MEGERKRIGLREVRSLEPGATAWDAIVPGFCARRRQSASIFYGLKYRTRDGRQRWHTIGRHGAPWTPDQARDEAQRLMREIAAGGDPSGLKQEARQAATVSELCDLYIQDAEAGRVLTRHGGTKKPSTLATDRSRISSHIKPLMGSLKVPAVMREDVEQFMHAVAAGPATKARKPSGRPRGTSNVRGGKGASSRTLGLLGAIFSYAVRKRLRPDNPVHGIVRHADGRRERRLSDEEYRLLGQGLTKAAEPSVGKKAGMWPPALAATRFLALTGWRTSEALTLVWQHVDLERRTARLPDTKTGFSARPLSKEACAVLRECGVGASDQLVFPPSRGTGTMSGFPKLFSRIAKLGSVPADVSPHVLRHSFASVAGDLGYSELTIAAMVGHKGGSMTSRYVHSADAVLLAAADAVAEKITVALRFNTKKIQA